jgi:hypothetical protein
MADKAPTREEMDKLYESFKDITSPGVMLPMGKEGMKDIMKELKKIRGMKDGGSVQKMEDGGKAVPVAKVKIERLKKMRDPYGESNFAHQISDGKDAYTQRVIAAMKESGQPFMDGGKVEKMNYGGKVKKMNMGGVVPGRGGSFKGVR